MNLSKYISLKKYVDSAKQDFILTKTNLSEIEQEFKKRMNGESSGKLIGTMFCTILWLGIFNVIYWLLHNIDELKVHLSSPAKENFLSCCFVISILLLFVMFIDELMLFFHYEKFSPYTDLMQQLKQRMISAELSLSSENEKLFSSQSKGLNAPILLASPISEEASLIKKSINSIDSLKKGGIENIKNIIFFILVALITAFILWLLLDPAVQILHGVWDDKVSIKVLRVLCIIAMVIVGIGEEFLAAAVWNKTDCSVKNKTLWGLFAGPVLFVLFVLVINLLVLLVILIGIILLGLLKIAVALAAIALVFSCCCGG